MFPSCRRARTIAEAGECPLARVLAAMVYVARGVPEQAQRELDAGLMDMDDAADAHAPFSVVALHWLSGLLHLARGDDRGARASRFSRRPAIAHCRWICQKRWISR
ncbi:MAG TPA: hypothetical protein VHB78_09130 [Vicinamibacterales bacterium]|jgi:hypothetical protein|nr:hypothetical protein [Vicinamibacterales bacterium]